MKKIIWIFISTIVIVLFSDCGNDNKNTSSIPSENTNVTTDAADESIVDKAVKDDQTPGPADDNTKKLIRKKLENYLGALRSGSFDASDYFADEVDQYISMMNTTPGAITSYIKETYQIEFQNGNYFVEDEPFEVTELANGDYEASFIEKGSCIRKSLSKTQHVRIKIKALLNSDFKIYDWQEIQILENKLD